MTKQTRPAWLIGLGLVGGLAALAAATGCGRLASEVNQQHALKASAPQAQVQAAVVHLTSASMPRLAFASPSSGDALLREGDRPLAGNGLCPPDMATIDDKFCVDKYEASLVEVSPNGSETAFPYYESPAGHTVRAVSEKGVYPQGYISMYEARDACRASGKRLCKPQEFRNACGGPEKKKFGYGNEQKPGTCNDNGRSPMGFFHSAEIATGKAWTAAFMNDPQLNQLAGTLAETGSHEGCTNEYGVHDMVGNLHEWVDDPKGTFQGGYYLDVTQNGDGCGYRTDAHESWYHDYSTGFRCCADVAQ